MGGAGFVGSNLSRLILDTNSTEILVVDNLLSSERENLPISSNLEFIEGSITDNLVLEKIKDEFDYIFHLATYHGNQSSIINPLADHENNTLSTLKLFNHIKSFKRLKKVIYSSAGCSVAEKTFSSTSATTEDGPVSFNQDSPYSISKIIGEFYAVYYHKHHELPTIRARFQNVYGPGEVLGAGKWRGTIHTIWRNVTPTFIYKAISNEPLPVENEGVATRDFIYIDDICRGLIACADKGIPGEVYNIASGIEVSIKQLAEIINKQTGNTAGIKFLPKRSWDNSGKRYGSVDKAKMELGFAVKMPFNEGVIKTIEWTKRNLDFINKQINKHNGELALYSKDGK